MEYEIVLNAKQAADRNAWLDARTKGIGGSDAAAIVGLNKWKSAFTLWSEKTGNVEPDDISDKDVVYWGTQLEDMVAREFTKRTGLRVKAQGLYRNIQYPFMLASVDRLVIGERAGLECKTTSAYKVKEWEGDNVPDSYYIQCQHYMMVTGYKKWYIAVLIGGNHFIYKEIPRNEEDIAALREAEIDFWHKVENNIMPEVDGSSSATKVLMEKYKGGNFDVLEMNDSEELLKRLDQLNSTIEELSKEAAAIKNTLCARMGDHERAVAGGYEISWKTVAGRKTVDTKALQKNEPEIFNKYVKVGKPSRRFTYGIKKED